MRRVARTLGKRSGREEESSGSKEGFIGLFMGRINGPVTRILHGARSPLPRDSLLLVSVVLSSRFPSGAAGRM